MLVDRLSRYVCSLLVYSSSILQCQTTGAEVIHVELPDEIYTHRSSLVKSLENISDDSPRKQLLSVRI